MRKANNSAGFTLVEVIVVLVILAILIALMAPTLTGYIDKAKARAVEVEAKGIYTAAQTAISEQYALNPSFKDRASLFNYNGKKYGRVTNNMLYTVQRTGSIKNSDSAIAKEVLNYLDSSKYSTATYKMNSQRNPLGENVSAYEDTYNQPGILICYDAKGVVEFVEFGRSGVLVHIDSSGVTSTIDGSFTNGPLE